MECALPKILRDINPLLLFFQTIKITKFMTRLKIVLSTFTLLVSLPIFGQIEKGNYNLGGNVELNGSFFKTYWNQFIGFNASISPSVNKFVSNKLMLGFRPIVSASVSSGNYGYSSNINRESIVQLGVEGAGRYYFNEKSKVKLFAFATASFNRTFQAIKVPSFQNASGQTNYINAKMGIGADFIINKEVAIEGKLSYFHREVPRSYIYFDPTKYYSKGTDNLELIFNFNHFIPPFSINKSEDNTEYIKKGRRTLGGHIRFWAEKEAAVKIVYLNSEITPQFSQFITDRWMLSSAVQIVDLLANLRETGVSFNVTGRYYKPITHRFFLYPQMAIATSYSRHLSFTGIGLNLGAGGSYFLSKNVALDASFVKVNIGLMGYLDTSLGAGQIGLLYFIR
jgi:hypothetical protein